jgi:hypothetical protein
MPDCLRTDIRDVLPDWVHGSLDEHEGGEVAKHIATCAACTAEVELLRAVRRVLTPEPRIDVGRIAAAVVEQTARGRAPLRQRRHWPTVLGGLAVAASIAFGLLLVRGGEEGSEPVGSIATTDTTDTISMQVVTPPSVPDDARPARDTSRAGEFGTAPRLAPALPEPEMRVAVSEMAVSGGLSDLEVDQLEALLRRLDGIEALPQTSPAPLLTTDLEVR